MSSVEEDIRRLLEETRAANEQYESAKYRDPKLPGRSGISARLEAIEEGLLRLARAVDEQRSS